MSTTETPPIERLEIDPATVGNMLVALGAAKHAVGFTPEVGLELAKPLDWDRVKKKPGQGNFDYLPHADVRRTANAIFGFDGWGYTTDSVQIVAQGALEKGDRKGVQACAIARVTLKLRLQDGTWLEKGGIGEGTGNGYGPTAAVEAPGKAAKEAESDALKRAFINLGDQFGLILYAKDEERASLQAEAEAGQNAEQQQAEREATIAELRATDEQVEEVKAMASRVSDDVRAKTDAAIKQHRDKNETERYGVPIVDKNWLAKLADGIARQAGEKARDDAEPHHRDGQRMDGVTHASETTEAGGEMKRLGEGLKLPDGVQVGTDGIVTDGSPVAAQDVDAAFEA